MSETALTPLQHHVPTVAVKFHKEDLLIVGNGSSVKVYNYKTNEVLATKKVFKKNKVHGIAVDRDYFAFYGARSFNMLSLKQLLEDDNLVDNEKMANDWIIAGEFSYKGWELFLLTAHNVILSIDSYSETLQWEKSVYGEKSILYSGSIKVTSPHEVFVNAGTVMGGVVIWDLFKEEIIHNLSGHEGSIFNVKTSDNDKYIVSCSDDRSIKLWDFKSGELLSTAWGHTARIWNLKFYNDDQSVVSVSEDLTSRTWNITEDQQFVSNQTYDLHSGRHIWGLDVNDREKIAATGGNDGRIRIIDINPTKVANESEHFSLQHITSGSEYGLQKNEIVKGFWKLNVGLVLITSRGGIFIYKDSKWLHVKTDVNFCGFALTNGFPSQNIITFTNAKGYTSLLKFDNEGRISDESTIETIVSKVINAISTSDRDSLYLLVESPNTKDKLHIYEINSDLEVVNTTLIEKRPTFVTTCFDIHEDLVFIGYRLSSLGVYRLSTTQEVKFIKKLSLSDTITSILKVDVSNEQILLRITNRDGYYVYFKFNSTTYNHEAVHTNNTRKGFLEGSYEINNEMVVYGFKSSYFYIFNESRQFEIAYENCGGAHRLWNLNYNDGAFQFTYVRDGNLNIRTIPKSAYPDILTEGTHGREIRDISIRQKSYKGNNALYITGAEDTTLKLSTFDLISGDVRNYWSMRKHTSGLQKVKFLNDSIIGSSSAREEFFLWKVDEEFEYPLLGVIGTLNPSSDNPDLRIMDFTHLLVYEGDEVAGILLTLVYSDSAIKSFYFDLKSREFTPVISGNYKTCCIFGVEMFIQSDRVLLVTATTDGYLTTWDITKEVQFNVEDSQLQFAQVMTQELPKPNNTVAIHQNGIKSFVIIPREKSFVIASGGDDNGLGITEVTLEESGIFTSELLSFEPDAASSTIASVSTFSDNKLLVASVDQIVRLWSFKSGKLELIDSHYTTVADTGSSDVFVKDGKSYGLIGGVGLSIWAIK